MKRSSKGMNVDQIHESWRGIQGNNLKKGNMKLLR